MCARGCARKCAGRCARMAEDDQRDANSGERAKLTVRHDGGAAVSTFPFRMIT